MLTPTITLLAMVNLLSLYVFLDMAQKAPTIDEPTRDPVALAPSEAATRRI